MTYLGFHITISNGLWTAIDSRGRVLEAEDKGKLFDLIEEAISL